MDDPYNVDLLGGSRVSDQAWQNSIHVAISASALAHGNGYQAWVQVSSK
jgi:non-heme chloroperoxidase